nr:PhzF family phenazine biosynthesis protein [Sinorhizobium meliloti]
MAKSLFEAISQYLADTPHLQSLRRHPVPSSSRRRKKLHTSRTPTPDAFRWGRHHLGIRGRLFLGIGGRDHFGIRGRIASEFATGTAAGPLAAYLAATGNLTNNELVIEQGTKMGRRSILRIRLAPLPELSGAGIVVVKGVIRL